MNKMQQTDLLSDLASEPILIPVSTGTRFANYLIDVVMAIIFYLAVAFVVIIISIFFLPRLVEWADENSAAMGLIEQASAYVIIPVYFILMEGLTKGRTVGKLITGTVAVRQDGTPLTWNNVIARSFSRVVPFESLSGFSGTPWHDKWTDTTVVKKPSYRVV